MKSSKANRLRLVEPAKGDPLALDAWPSQFAHSKLTVPVPHREWVERDRLIARLQGDRKYRLTLLSAPAGFGKTSLLGQWLSRTSLRVVWLSLDALDKNFERFAGLFSVAIESHYPDAAAKVRHISTGYRIPPLEICADSFLQAVSSNPQQTVIVLDDYHFAEGSEVDQFLSRLVEFLPDHLRLVIATRKAPDWIKRKWFLKGWVNEIRTKHLAFELDETCRFLSNVDPSISKAQVLKIQNLVEGWVAGLQVAKLFGPADSLNVLENLNNSARNHHFLSEYLLEEVISRESQDVQDFLMISAQLECFCQPLCDKILSDIGKAPSAVGVIPQLLRSNLFIMKADRVGVWYRYHQLFAEVVRGLAQRELSVTPQEIHRSAGEWFDQQGAVEEALDSFLRAGDLVRASSVFARSFRRLLVGDLSRRTIERILDRFPAGSEILHPAFQIARAYICLARSDIQRMSVLCDSAEALLNSKTCKLSPVLLADLQCDLDALRTFCHFWSGDLAAAILSGKKVLKVGRLAEPHPRAIAVLYGSVSLVATGQYQAGLDLVLDEIDANVLFGQPSQNRNSLFARIAIHFWAGEIELLSMAADDLIRKAGEGNSADFYRLQAFYFRARAFLERNDLDNADDFLARVEPLRFDGPNLFYLDSLIGRALIALARGDQPKAQRFKEAARRVALDSGERALIRSVESLGARLELLSGGSPSMSAAGLIPAELIAVGLELPVVTKMECVVHSGDLSECEAELPEIENALRCARELHRRSSIIELLAIQSVALWRAERREEALTQLREALALGEKGGFVRIFVDRTPRIRELIQTLADRTPTNSYFRLLLEAHANTSVIGVSPIAREAERSRANRELPLDVSGRGPLSNRELDVLEMVSRRLQNKEIAGVLHISPETAKKHLANIYRKLGVHGRQAAVKAGRRFGLLRPQ